MQTTALQSNERNRIREHDLSIHGWYRFVLSFPPHLVREYLERFNITGSHLVLDPFSGTGTTLVECKKEGIPSVGIEANPMAWYASKVKADWIPSSKEMLRDSDQIANEVNALLLKQGILDVPLPLMMMERVKDLESLSEDKMKLLLKNSMSPLPMHKAIILLRKIREMSTNCRDHFLLALAQSLVSESSNLYFGPEVGVKKIKEDAAVVAPWLERVVSMANDIRENQTNSRVPCKVIRGDARQASSHIEPESVSFVFTSPPYPNEKDYTRTTRLESVFLGFVESKKQLRAMKQGLLRSNTRNVYKDDDDDSFISHQNVVTDIADQIEQRRIDLGKTSGFERQYSRVTKLYFGGMSRHLAEMRPLLKPGTILAYVVGDQASYLRVMIRTGEILAQIAEGLGYTVLGLDLFRTRVATATKAQLKEEVLLLQWK